MVGDELEPLPITCTADASTCAAIARGIAASCSAPVDLPDEDFLEHFCAVYGGVVGLAACPCGAVPDELLIVEGASHSHSFVSGKCCNEWFVEFYTGYHHHDGIPVEDRATSAWNDAVRGKNKP